MNKVVILHHLIIFATVDSIEHSNFTQSHRVYEGEVQQHLYIGIWEQYVEFCVVLTSVTNLSHMTSDHFGLYILAYWFYVYISMSMFTLAARLLSVIICLVL